MVVSLDAHNAMQTQENAFSAAIDDGVGAEGLIATCARCGRSYLRRRPWQRFCCSACRGRHHADLRKSGDVVDQSRAMSWRATDGELRRARELRSEGATLTIVADRVFGFSRRSLARRIESDPRLREALEVGRAMLEDCHTQNVHHLAFHAKNEQTRLTASLSILNSLFGWRSDRTENTNVAVAVRVALPEPQALDAYEARIVGG